MSSINLVPAERIERVHAIARIKIWSIRVAILLVVCGGILGLGRHRVRRIQTQAMIYEIQFVEQQDRVELAESLIDARDQMNARREVIYSIHDRVPFVTVLNKLGRAMPENTALTYMELEPESAAERSEAGAAPVLLRGYAESHADIGTLLRGLQSIEGLRDVNLVRLTERTYEERQMVEFEVAAYTGRWETER